MNEVVVGMVVGAVLGSLLTAAYLGICLKEDESGGKTWIDSAIARAFAAVEDPTVEEHTRY